MHILCFDLMGELKCYWQDSNWSSLGQDQLTMMANWWWGVACIHLAGGPRRLISILDFVRGETEKEQKSDEVEESRGRSPLLPSPSLRLYKDHQLCRINGVGIQSTVTCPQSLLFFPLSWFISHPVLCAFPLRFHAHYMVNKGKRGTARSLIHLLHWNYRHFNEVSV